jgi:hypothetical protein
MTPKQKSEQLIKKFTLDFTMDFQLTKEASLVCINEIIKSIDFNTDSDFWKEVKKEINKL